MADKNDLENKFPNLFYLLLLVVHDVLLEESYSGGEFFGLSDEEGEVLEHVEDEIGSEFVEYELEYFLLGR